MLLHGPHRNISLKTIRSILLRYAFDCGISLEFSDLTKSPVYYQQAKTAYRYGVKEETDRKQHFFRDYYRHSLVDALSKRYAPDFFIHPKLYELIHHDAIHRSQLSETLYQYLDAYKNINTTAKILHIHRNTLQYRLKKIEEILSISFNDPPSCHQLHIGLMLLKKTRAF
ncbi:MAG TPA: hypothetical protein DHN33_11130 [Eubacteriaceae bacterium]|nr:hypothetical protein [Eubacteriaceae bacterium]